MIRKVKVEDGGVCTLNTETLPDEVRQVMMQNDIFEKPTQLMTANERRAHALHTFVTHDMNKVSPALTSAYRLQKETLPHEQVRTNFVE